MSIEKQQPKELEIKNILEKQLYEYFKRQNLKIVHDMNWTWLKWENFKRENESL